MSNQNRANAVRVKSVANAATVASVVRTVSVIHQLISATQTTVATSKKRYADARRKAHIGWHAPIV